MGLLNRKAKKAAGAAKVADIQARRKNACVTQRRALAAEGTQGWPTDGCNVTNCGRPCLS